MKNRRLFTIVLALTFALSMLAASVSVTAAAKPTKMTIKASSTSLYINESTKVAVKSVSPKKASKKVSWKSSNKKIATVSSTGVVKAKKAGSVKITATSKSNKKLKKSVTIKVKSTPSYNYTERTVFVDSKFAKTALLGNQKGYEKAKLIQVSWGKANNKEEKIAGAVHFNSDYAEIDDCDPWPNGNGIDDIKDYNDNDIIGANEIDPDNNFNLRESEQFDKVMKAYGITADSKVILYGSKASDSSVTRVAFAMINAGVKDVKIIDGGLEGWKSAGFKTTTKAYAEPVATKKDFDGVKKNYIASIEEVKDADLANNPDYALVSIRSTDEFEGKVSGYGYIDNENAGEPEGAVWGHDTDDNSYTKKGKVVGIDTLKKYLQESSVNIDDDITVSFYCGTGWRATIPWLIAYQAGYDNIKLYDGGWYQWQYRALIKGDSSYKIQKISAADAAKNHRAIVNHYVTADDLDSLSKEYKLIDVREAADFDKGHIAGSESAAVPDHDAYSKEAIANLSKVVKKYGTNSGKYVLICYTGQKYAGAATTALRNLDVDPENIYTLEGGFNEWSKTRPFVVGAEELGNVTVYPAEKKVTLEAEVNDVIHMNNIDDQTHHFVVNKKGTNGTKCVLPTDALPYDVYNALKLAGGTPEDNCDNAKNLCAANHENGEFLKMTGSKVDIDVTWEDNGKEVTKGMGEVLKRTGEHADEAYDDSMMEFAGCVDMYELNWDKYNISANYRKSFGNDKINMSGCITCTFSCWIGTCSNGAYGYNSEEVVPNRDVLPAPQTPVVVTYQF